MQNSVNFERFRTTDPKRLASKGCDIQKGKILCAASARIKRYQTAIVPVPFRCSTNKEGKVDWREWIPVTKKEAERIKSSLDPVTKQPYLKFAYVPMPKVDPSNPANQITEIDMAGPEDLGEGIEVADVAAAAPAAPKEPVKFDDEGEGEEPVTEPEGEEESEEEAGDEFDEIENSGGDESTSLERADLEAKTVAELKAELQDLGIKAPSKAKKEELIELILG